MAASSESSDVNLHEMEQLVQDMDNLDKELFNDSFERIPSSAGVLKSSNLQTNEEMKKRVAIKDPNENDSLGSSVSEEEYSPRENKNQIAIESKSTRIENLFKLKTTNPPLKNTSSFKDKLIKSVPETKDVDQAFARNANQRTSKPENSPTLQAESSVERNTQNITNVFNDDVLANLIDRPRAVDNKTKKSTVMEELFEKNPPPSIINTIIHEDTAKVNLEATRGSTIKTTSSVQLSKPQSVNYTARSVPREPRRGRRNSKIINDPLGLLLPTDYSFDQGPSAVTIESAQISDSGVQSTKVQKDLPEWLGGAKDLKEKKSKGVQETTALKDRNAEAHGSKNTTELTRENGLENKSSCPEQFSLLMGTQFDQQAAIMTMQQQEHELRTANMLSQQNAQLSNTLGVQQSRLNHQEKQFNALIQMQLERQASLEKQIKVHQDRIDQYIQVLMAQPTSVPISAKSFTTMEGREELISKTEEVENLLQKLNAEKIELESTLRTLNERHETEVTVQAESYRRQILYLQESMTNLEKRARQEMEILEADYAAKLEKLKEEKIQTENSYKEEINTIKMQHARHIEEIYAHHSQNIKFLQKEHCETIDNISKARQAENLVIEVTTNRKIDIENMLQKANLIIENIKENQEKIELRDNRATELRENYLKIQEDDIQVQKLHLAKRNDMLDEHRTKLIDSIETWDLRLVQLTTELQKQSTYCQKTQEILDKNTTNLLRERELFEEKVKWERNYLQTLKESWMKEQERQLKLLAKAAEAIATERAQLDVLNRLKTNTEDVAKIELEAAIKTAQDVASCAKQEKLRWHERINALEIEQEHLRSKENLLAVRAKELEELTQSALTKREEGNRALKKAKRLEDCYKEKFGQMQKQIDALMQREKKMQWKGFARQGTDYHRDCMKVINQKKANKYIFREMCWMNLRIFPTREKHR